MSEQYERRVEVSPGFFLIHREDHKNYGIASCLVWFYVIGSKGAVQWQIGTDWYPEAARRHRAKFPPSNDRQPSAWDIGYHSRKPMYEDHKPMPGDCSLLGGECYYDGSSLQADKWIEGFLNGGTAWLWPKLEEYYRAVFEDGPYPDLTPVIRKHKPEDQEGAIYP